MTSWRAVRTQKTRTQSSRTRKRVFTATRRFHVHTAVFTSIPGLSRFSRFFTYIHGFFTSICTHFHVHILVFTSISCFHAHTLFSRTHRHFRVHLAKRTLDTACSSSGTYCWMCKSEAEHAALLPHRYSRGSVKPVQRHWSWACPLQLCAKPGFSIAASVPPLAPLPSSPLPSLEPNVVRRHTFVVKCGSAKH